MRNYLFIISAMFFAVSCASSDEKAETASTATLISDTTKQASCVYLAADEKNQPVISWCETDKSSGNKSFYFAFFNEKQGSFSNRINIPIEQNASLHEEGMPKIAFKGDGTIIAVYETAVNSEKNRFAGFVRYIVSSDKGKTWTTPACLHADTSSDKSHSFAAITRLSDGQIGACWLDESFDEKIGGRPVKFAKTNSNNMFGNELIVDSVACQCCRIAMASGPDGRITVAFRDILNDSIRDMSVISSIDNGKTFTPAVPFSNDGWVINGCPHNGPSLALAGNVTCAVWFTGGDKKGMYYGELNNKMRLTTKQLISDHGRFIQLCLLRDRTPVLAYNETIQEGNNIYSKITVNKIVDDKVFASDIISRKSKASYPVLRPVGDNKVVVAWWENDKIYYTLTTSDSIKTPVQRSPATGGAVSFNLSKIKLAASKDLVCGMPLSMSPGDTATLNDKIYGFCSQTCKEHFLQHPESFVAK